MCINKIDWLGRICEQVRQDCDSVTAVNTIACGTDDVETEPKNKLELLVLIEKV
jgi:hypothetical protein